MSPTYSQMFLGEKTHTSVNDKANGAKGKQVVNPGKEINTRSFLDHSCHFSVGLTYQNQKVTKTHIHNYNYSPFNMRKQQLRDIKRLAWPRY